MIDIDFLTPPMRLKSLSGAEFIDYQGKDFFNALTKFTTEIFDPVTYEFNWSLENRKRLAGLIASHNNMYVSPNVGVDDNLGINAGFVSPNNILNLPNADATIGREYSNIGDFFREFKKKSLVGWCDLKTGKVEGDFKKVHFYLSVPVRMQSLEGKSVRLPLNMTIPQVVAAGILHELGHGFFSLYTVSSSTMEDIFFMKTAAMINNEKDKAQKIKIVTGLKKETGIDVSDEVEKTGNLTVVGFKQGMADRNYRRTLSLGVTVIAPEILANAYAVRMGASVGVSAMYANSGRVTDSLNRFRLAELGAFGLMAAIGAPALFVVSLFAVRAYSLVNALGLELTNTTHEIEYRTIKSILRDVIDILRKARKDGDKKVIDELTKEAMTIDKMAEEAKPLLEGTFVQSLLAGRLWGKDVKRMDFETQTAELNYNPLSIYTQFNEKR